MPKIDHIVQASGVSRSTVFRYLAGKPVRPGAAASIARVLDLLQAPSGTGSAHVRDYLVSVVSTYTRFRGYAEVLEGVLQRVQETGGTVRIGGRQSHAPLPSGVILVGKNRQDEDAESLEWQERGVPCVLVNRIPDESERSWVAVDCRRAAREAVAHLIVQGCRRIALWTDEASRVSRDKKRGYQDALEEAGLADPGLVFDSVRHTLEEALVGLFDTGNAPDGWFCPDDETAARVLSFAASRGIAVPRDLAVVGMNDIETAAHLVPSLSSVRLPFRDMGGAAVDALRRLIEKPKERSVRILMAHELIVRDSSRKTGLGGV